MRHWRGVLWLGAAGILAVGLVVDALRRPPSRFDDEPDQEPADVVSGIARDHILEENDFMGDDLESAVTAGGTGLVKPAAETPSQKGDEAAAWEKDRDDAKPDRDRQIRDKAYALWEGDGRPEGRHDEHWERARRIVDGEEDAGAGS